MSNQTKSNQSNQTTPNKIKSIKPNQTTPNKIKSNRITNEDNHTEKRKNLKHTEIAEKTLNESIMHQSQNENRTFKL
jgi:hypothetical protein